MLMMRVIRPESGEDNQVFDLIRVSSSEGRETLNKREFFLKKTPSASSVQDKASPRASDFFMISHKNWPLQELLMGVETPIPPKMINAAAPDGAPPRRIKMVEIIICQFSWSGCERQFMCVSPAQKKINKKCPQFTGGLSRARGHCSTPWPSRWCRQRRTLLRAYHRATIP